MTFGEPNPFRNFRFPNRNGQGGRKIGTLPLTIFSLVVVAVILVSLSGFYVDYLWFKSVDFGSVWREIISTKIALFIFFGLLTSGVITLNIWFAYKKRPLYVPTSVEADN